MEPSFIDNLKSFSMQDVLEEHRPTTGFRLSTASARRGPLPARPPTASRSQPIIGQGEQEEGEITTLASYRPESAAFTFSFNRPKTGRLGSARPSRSLSSARNDGKQPQGNWDSSGFNNVRPMSSARPGTGSRSQNDTTEYIPDLEEVQEQDLAMTVASAPAYEVQKMTSLKELDAELLHSKPFSVVNGVDLRKLCKFLVPEKDLVEHDEYWTWDRLYTEIISTPELTHLVRFQKKETD